MLPVKRRIPKQSLLMALKQNKVFLSEFFALRVHWRKLNPIPTPSSSNNNLFSVIIANKVLPRAVDRHLIKRRIHQIIAKKLRTQELKETQASLIVQVKKNPLALSFSALEQEIVSLFKQANLLN